MDKVRLIIEGNTIEVSFTAARKLWQELNDIFHFKSTLKESYHIDSASVELRADEIVCNNHNIEDYIVSKEIH